MDKKTLYAKLLQSGDFLFGIAVLSVVFILIFPLPPVFIDILISISLGLSMMVILMVTHTRSPADFSVFPTILLVFTLFRLGLNIATTRAILTTGEPGHLVTTFGEFVIQGNLIVGLIVFFVLTIINFVVITKGAGRVAEVAARFTLDAMPGKQMSIDADLNAGLISEQDARRRRQSLEEESSFYGAMDGASKFVRGEAVAGLLITGINLAGGFAVGMLQMGLSASASIDKFCLLSVGDGLVSQIPALLVSTASGVLVTRSKSNRVLGEDVTAQILSNRKTVFITGGLLLTFTLVPGFPWGVLLILGMIFIGIGLVMPSESEIREENEKSRREARQSTGEGGEQKALPPGSKPEKTPAPTGTEVLAIEIGFDLLPIVQGNLQNMLDRIGALRRSLSVDWGIQVPPIAMRDNTALAPHQYRFLLRGHEVAMGELYLGQLLAMGVGTAQRPLRGRVTVEPAFGLPATWIQESDRRDAERMGYAVVDPISVLITHLSETLKTHAADLLSRQDVQSLLDVLKETQPALLQEMNALQLGLGIVHRVLQNLLRESVSIRELPIILEKLCDQIVYTKNPDELGEACRKALIFEISRQFELHNGRLRAVTMHPEIEQALVKCLRQTSQEISIVMDPVTAKHIHDHLALGMQELLKDGQAPILICSPMVRLGLKRFFGETFPLLKVIAYNEIPSKVQVQSAHVIRPVGQ